MSTPVRILAALTIASVLATAAVAVAAAGAVCAGGWIVVHVHEKHDGGANVRLALPGAAASLAMAVVPDRLFHPIEMSDEALHWVPVARAAIAELERAPDGVYVEVEDGRESVRIAKEDGTLLVDVDSPTESVHLSIPVHTVSAVADRVLHLAAARTRSV